LVDKPEPYFGRLNKTRPAVIVNDDALGKLPLKIIVPITDWKDKYEIVPWMVKIEPDFLNGLNKVSAIDRSIKCIKKYRISE